MKKLDQTRRQELKYDDVLKIFPDVLDAYQAAQLEKKRARKLLKPGGKLRAVDLQRGALGQGRNTTLFNCLIAWVIYRESEPSFDETAGEAQRLNSMFQVPLDESEVANVVQSAHIRGLDARAARDAKNAALLAELTPIEEIGKVSSNGHHSGEVERFKYDYSHPFLKVNRFTEVSLVARVIQRFGPMLLKVDGNLYGFNPFIRLWALQSGANHEELASFVKNAALDTINDPRFITELCTQANGEVSIAKIKAAQNKFLSAQLHALIARTIRQSAEITRATMDIFDSQLELLYCENGVLNMGTGEIREAEATDYMLAKTNVSWDPEAKCPRWLKFLGEIFSSAGNSVDMVSFMQQLFGYSLSGCISEQKVFLHYGDGSNGKSKVLSALALICGGYATYTDPDELVRSKVGFTRNFERFGSKIEGKRAAVIDDIDVKTIWNEAFVKNVTGPKVRARAEYEKSRAFANRCKLHLGVNTTPAPDAENYGLLRRMCVIPYDRKFIPSTEESDRIDLLIQEEASGILRWAVEGYRIWNTKGLPHPSDIETSIEEYRQQHFQSESVISQLFSKSSKPEEDKDSWYFLTDLVLDVNSYFKAAGEVRQMTCDELGIALKRQGIEVKKVWSAEKKNAFRAAHVELKFERQEKSLKDVL